MWASDTAELVFEDVRVPNENLLGEEGRGFYQLASGLQRERLLSAVLSVSAAGQALDDTLDFLKSREAFDKPLAEFQALRHRIADMATSIRGSEAIDLRRGGGIRERRGLRDRSLHGGNSFQLRWRIALATRRSRCMAVWGTCVSLPVERFARDYRLWTIAAGSSEMMREIIAKRLLG